MKEKALEPFKAASRGFEDHLKKTVNARVKGPSSNMYRMQQYFLGHLEEDLKTLATPRGKRFRPYLSLYLAKSHGVHDKILDAALAIELFHNFTLIHDDVEDNDESRRGRPTVWKLWGVNHAINAGDALALIASEMCVDVARIPESGHLATRALLSAFRGVCEGQYLDFQLADAPMKSKKVSEKSYLAMAEKKAGILVGVSAEIVGIIAERPKPEREALRRFGASLGLAYQIADDYRSLWGASTGKALYGDVRERKRSLPVLVAISHSVGRNRDRLIELFDARRRLMDLEVIEAVALIDMSGAQSVTLEAMRQHVEKVHSHIDVLSISARERKELRGLVQFLIPEIK